MTYVLKFLCPLEDYLVVCICISSHVRMCEGLFCCDSYVCIKVQHPFQ